MFSVTVIFLGTLYVVGTTNAASVDLDYLIPPHRDSVSSLRDVLKNELTQDYMMEDYWLTNWLQINDFEVDNTNQKINQYLQFRNQQNVNKILDEDWSEMRVRFPYSRDTIDKSGKPVKYVDFSQWDIASYLTTNEASERLLRYIIMIDEESEAHVRQLRADGRNISQYTEIYNVGGFSPSKHTCMQCAYVYHDISQILAPHSPPRIEKTVFVNVPYLFKMVYYFFGDESRKTIHLYGQDQEELEKMLASYIDREQFPKGILEQPVDKDNSEGSMIWNKEL